MSSAGQILTLRLEISSLPRPGARAYRLVTHFHRHLRPPSQKMGRQARFRGYFAPTVPVLGTVGAGAGKGRGKAGEIKRNVTFILLDIQKFKRILRTEIKTLP